MAIKFPPQFKFATMDAKTRLFVIVAIVAFIFFLGYLAYRYFGGGAGAAGPSKVATAPSGLQSVPGSQLSPEYYRALMQANQQAAQQAQITGGSAVPTLINVQGQQSSNCTVLCPGDEGANVADDINDLVKNGKLSQEDANRLLDLAKRNVSVADYAAALDELVRQGKLTPEQARALLEKYKKQHENALLNESAQAMDGLIKSGQLPLDVANELLELQKRHLTPAEYAAELARLVREGKITPEMAAALLAQYSQQQAREKNNIAAAGLMQMAKDGSFSPEVANALIGLQKRNVGVDAYGAELNRLVAAGKMSPETAARLLALYKQQRASIVSCDPVNKLISQGGAVGAQGQKLLDMQTNNVSLTTYTDELKRAVQVGTITPDIAANILKQCQMLFTIAAAPAGALPTIDTNIPGAEDFARLQQRLQTAVPVEAPVSADQFAVTQTQVVTETASDRQQRIQDLMNAMSTQAATLVAAWQPVTMQHVQGSAEKIKEAALLTTGAAGTTTTTVKQTVTEVKPALIKAGTILFGILDTAVNSDYPDTPVMATVVSGPLKGARLIGKLALAQGQDRVTLNFTLMDMEGWPSAKSVSAFAIDPDTARTALANEVNYHYLMRYGSVFASSFLSGYASAIQSSGSVQTVSPTASITATPPLSAQDKFRVALGQVGTTLSGIVQGWVNTPNTVKVNAGVAIGILFTTEVAS